ncbi:hypothetical protein CENA302_10945 [Cylindrospermopsis raciborskii CENA302]|uniref:DUF29 domain-containing protein n=2 Tax=Cylindrospermopsis raciborskii TaxID=77022 RepID=A0A9Q5QW13_9CYAN|nr:hypothetical protein BCV64_03610 [Cylindrospermopsis raciborskii MVCC14]OPH09488.1 hypothetical protein CENA302_10945 [Cylindrospermopsis raciborskii CENA302]
MKSQPSLYEQDFALWSEKMADLIAAKRFEDLDIDNLVEEIRDLSKRERDRLLSSVRLILHHLLKWDHQPEKRSRSWQITIERERKNLDLYLEDSLSLKRYFCQEWVNKMYLTARLDAMKDTEIDMPQDCSYSLQDVVERALI